MSHAKENVTLRNVTWPTPVRQLLLIDNFIIDWLLGDKAGRNSNKFAFITTLEIHMVTQSSPSSRKIPGVFSSLQISIVISHFFCIRGKFCLAYFELELGTKAFTKTGNIHMFPSCRTWTLSVCLPLDVQSATVPYQEPWYHIWPHCLSRPHW